MDLYTFAVALFVLIPNFGQAVVLCLTASQ